MKRELFFYSPNEVLPEEGLTVLTIEERANGEQKYGLSFVYNGGNWFTEDQSFSVKPKVLMWAHLPRIEVIQ